MADDTNQIINIQNEGPNGATSAKEMEAYLFKDGWGIPMYC